LLYLVVMIAVLVVPIELAQNSSSIYLAQDVWAGSYVVLDSTVSNGTTGLQYSRGGEKMGEATFTYFQDGWSVQPGNGSQLLENIIYTYPLPNQTYPRGTKFSATCKGNTSRNCIIGGLASQLGFPTSIESSPNATPTPEFQNYISLIITSLVPFSLLNISSNTTTAWTSNQAYQGTGQVYAPLGYWSMGSNPILDVAWSTSSFGACQGLQVFLSSDKEGIAWIVLGLVWQWWMMWGENDGGCINWANSLVTLGPTGLPLNGR
jgi:hypothetical protein